MLIKEFRILNYKSYRDAGPIQLSAGFNVFIGKNNGGKTALLQALSLSTLVNKPHRHSGIPRGQSLQPQSRVELTVTLTPGLSCYHGTVGRKGWGWVQSRLREPVSPGVSTTT